MADRWTLLPGGRILRIGEKPEEGDYEIIGPPLEIPHFAVGLVEQTTQRLAEQISFEQLMLVCPTSNASPPPGARAAETHGWPHNFQDATFERTVGKEPWARITCHGKVRDKYIRGLEHARAAAARGEG